MKKALIYDKDNNTRIFQIENNSFEVGYPFTWIDCLDEITTEYTYENGQFISPKIITDEITIQNVRHERNMYLSLSDWTQLPDTTPPGGKEVWATYRQELRDITKTFSDITSIVWPSPPSNFTV
jgi:hypothetical protein